MTFKETLRSTLKDFQSLMNVIYFSGWKVFGYFLILGLISSLPLFFSLTNNFRHVKQNIETVVQKVPDFTIEKNTLKVDNEKKGGIFLTNSLILTLDETGQRTPENIIADASATAASIGFLPHELVFGFPKGLSDFIPQDSYTVSYADGQLNGFSKKDLQLIPKLFPSQLWILFFFISFLAAIIDYLITIILLTFVAMVLGRFFFSLQIRFAAIFKIMIFASTWGVLLATFFHFLHVPFDALFLIGIPTVGIFLKMIKDLSHPIIK